MRYAHLKMWTVCIVTIIFIPFFDAVVAEGLIALIETFVDARVSIQRPITSLFAVYGVYLLSERHFKL